ncbi:MAG: DUF3445 domain-containing protein [Acidisphaera sp.]|nr:DUF3445 domain-containing protein [Acidisphaera sp.]
MAGPLYRPFASSPYRVSMDLESLRLADWIEIDSFYTSQMAEKRRLLAERHDDVFRALPEAADPSREVLALLSEHLAAHHSRMFRRAGVTLENLALGERWDLDATGLHPLDLAGGWCRRISA